MDLQYVSIKWKRINLISFDYKTLYHQNSSTFFSRIILSMQKLRSV